MFTSTENEMSEPTRIVVYTPAEAALLETDLTFPIIASIFFGVVAGFICMHIRGAYLTYIKRIRYNKVRDDRESVYFFVPFLVMMVYSLHRFGAF
jgi:hypothetical protein